MRLHTVPYQLRQHARTGRPYHFCGSIAPDIQLSVLRSAMALRRDVGEDFFESDVAACMPLCLAASVVLSPALDDHLHGFQGLGAGLELARQEIAVIVIGREMEADEGARRHRAEVNRLQVGNPHVAADRLAAQAW